MRLLIEAGIPMTWRAFFIKPVDTEFNLSEFLEQTSAYYRMLNEHDKKIFEKRILKFIRLKKFIPKEGIQISDEMKVLVASKAIQVTFGYPYINLNYLRRIYMYPRAYKSETDYFYHGETSTEGYVKFSWQNFLEGEYDTEDGVSLGLHEFSHALHIENNIRNEYFLFINPFLLVRLRQGYETLKPEILSFKTPIRHYGVTNYEEFFAVCVEVFFEQPQALYEYNDGLYELMTKILRQDILEYKKGNPMS